MFAYALDYWGDHWSVWFWIWGLSWVCWRTCRLFALFFLIWILLNASTWLFWNTCRNLLNYWSGIVVITVGFIKFVIFSKLLLRVHSLKSKFRALIWLFRSLFLIAIIIGIIDIYARSIIGSTVDRCNLGLHHPSIISPCICSLPICIINIFQ